MSIRFDAWSSGTFLALIMAAASAVGVNALRERVDRARQVQTLIETVRTATIADLSLDLVGHANPALAALLVGQREQNARELDETLGDLRRLAADSQVAEGVAKQASWSLTT